MFYYNNYFKMGNLRFNDLRDLFKFRRVVVGKGFSLMFVLGSSVYWEYVYCVVLDFFLFFKV